MTFFAFLFYLAFTACSVYDAECLRAIARKDEEPTAAGLAKSTVVQNLLLGSAILQLRGLEPVPAQARERFQTL